MTYRALSCFKAYDVRGRICLELDGGLVEDPRFVDAPSALARMSRYVLRASIFYLLRCQGAGSEIQLADPIDQHTRDAAVDGYLEANRAEVRARGLHGEKINRSQFGLVIFGEQMSVEAGIE